MYLNRIIWIAGFFVISCNGQTEDSSVKTQKVVSTNHFEWLSYVDSTKKYEINSPEVDSIVLYFMKSSAPEVIGKNKVVIWKNNQELKTTMPHDFVDYKMINNNHFVFIDNRRRTISCSEVLFSQAIRSDNSLVFSYDDSNNNEVVDVKVIFIKGKVVLDILGYDSSLDKYEKKQIDYSLKF